MADLYTQIKSTIEKQVDKSERIRALVYDKARDALDQKLEAYSPPLSDAQKENQRQKLEIALAKIEAEYAEPMEDIPIGLEVDETIPLSKSQPVETRVEQNSLGASSPEPEAFNSASAVSPETAPYLPDPLTKLSENQQGRDLNADPEPAQNNASGLVVDAHQMSNNGNIQDDVSEEKQEYIDPFAQMVEDETNVHDPDLEDYEFDDEKDYAKNPSRSLDGRDDEIPAPLIQPNKKTKRSGLWIWVLILLILLGGAGGAAYMMRDQLSALMSSNDQGGSAEVESANQLQNDPVLPEQGDNNNQGDDIIGNIIDQNTQGDLEENIENTINNTINNVENNLPENVQNEVNTIVDQASETVRNEVQNLQNEVENIQNNVVEGLESLIPGNVRDVGGDAVNNPLDDVLQAPQLEENGAAEQIQGRSSLNLPPAQLRASLFEQNSDDNQVLGYEGVTTWSLEENNDENGNLKDVAVKAVVNLLDKRDMVVLIKVEKNKDPQYPAAHLIDVTFDVPPNFADGQVTKMGLITARPNLETVPTPLSGIVTPVTDGYFLVALPDSPIELQTNLKLLRDAPIWEIRIEYSSGRPGVLRIEKNVQVSRIFDAAFKQWGDEQ